MPWLQKRGQTFLFEKSKLNYNFYVNKCPILFVKLEPLIWITHELLGLTLNVRGPSYLGLTRSISWLLIPWLLTSPGHQQTWYWLYRICRSLSYLRKDFVISMWRNEIKCKYMFMFTLKNLARKGLSAGWLPQSTAHRKLLTGDNLVMVSKYFSLFLWQNISRWLFFA